MKHLLLISLFALPVVSCNQSKKDEEKIRDSSPQESTKQIAKSDFKILDSSYSLPVANHYNISADTAYFFDLPDSLHKRKEYLLKDENVEVLEQYNGFSFADYSLSPGKHIIGWLKTSDLEKMLFTPPRVAE